MVIDTSALVAMMTGEPSAERLVAALESETERLVSAATVVEAALVLIGRYGDVGDAQLDRFLRGIGAEVVPVGEEQVTLARDAGMRFGKGRHPAALNYGDCLCYALSVARQSPLLFVGDDFSKSDVEVCQW
jgi:ribonuclease VapC